MVAFVLPLRTEIKNQGISQANLVEVELVKGLKTGNKNSIEQLYRMYAGALHGIICRIVKFDEIAEDILQDTFVKIWKNIDQYDANKGRLFTWMSNLAKNAAIDQVRSKHYVIADKTDDLHDLSSDVLDQKSHANFNPDLIGLRRLTLQLKPEHKLVVDLFYFEGLTHVEVSEKLNIPLGTVKTKIRQAIIHLRQYFNETNSKLSAIA